MDMWASRLLKRSLTHSPQPSEDHPFCRLLLLPILPTVGEKGSAATVRSVGEHSTEVHREVPGARVTQGKSNETRQEPAALVSEQG